MADVNLDVLLTGDAKDLDAALREAKSQTRGLRTEFRELTAEERRNERAMEGVSRSANRYAKDQKVAKEITDQLNTELKEMRRDLQLAIQGLNSEGRALHGAARAARTKSTLTKQLAIDLKKQEISTRRAADALLEETKAAIAAAAGISRKGNAAKEAASEQELLALAAKHAADGMEHEAVVAALAAKEIDNKGRASKGAARKQHDLADAADDTRDALRRERDELSRLDMEWRRANWDKIIARRNESLNRSLLGEAAHIAALRAIVQPVRTLKWSSIMLGIAPVSAALIDVAGAAVTAVNSLTPLVASVGPMAIQTFGGMAGAATVLNFALEDVFDAVQDQDKFKELTDEAQDFVRMLRQDFLPAYGETRRQVQQGLFEGLTDGLQEARKAVPEIQKVLYNMALTVGDLGRRAGERVGRQGFREDILRIGAQQISLVDRGGRSILNLVSGIRHILVASRPLVREWSQEILEISQNFNRFMREAREDGSLKQFFKDALENSRQWFHILEDIGRIFVGVFTAGRQASETFMDALERTFDEWADFVNSTQGQNDVREYLNEAIEGAGQLWRIIEAVGGAIFRLGRLGNEHLGSLADFFEEDLVPSLEAFGTTLQHLLPHLLDMLAAGMQVSREMLEGLSAMEPVLNAIADALNAIFGTMSEILDVMPGVLKIPAGLVLGAAVLGGYRTLVYLLKEAARAAGLISLAGGVGRIAGGFGGKGGGKVGGGYKGPVGFGVQAAGSAAGIAGVVQTLKHPAVIAAVAATGAIAFGTLGGGGRNRPTIPGTNIERPNANPFRPGSYQNEIAEDARRSRDELSKLADLKLGALAAEIDKVGGDIRDLPNSKIKELQNRILDLNDETTGDVRSELRKLRSELESIAEGRKAFRINIAVTSFAEQLREMFRKGKEITASGASDIMRQFKKLPNDAKAAASGIVREFVQEMRRKGKIPPAVAKALMQGVTDEVDRGRQNSIKKLVRMGTSFAQIFGAFPKTTSEPLKVMGRQIDTFLKGLGMKPTGINISKVGEAAIIATNLFNKFFGAKAGGGYIGSPGQRGSDKRIIAVGDGEAVVNAPQQGPIQTALAYAKAHGVQPYGSLRDLFTGVTSKHYLAGPTAHLPMFARGGFTPGSLKFALGPYSIPPIQYDPNHAGGNSHLHLSMTSVAAAKALAARMRPMGWSASESPWAGGLSVAHSDPGHYSGSAFDANTAADETHSEVAAVARLLAGGGGARLGGGFAELKLPRFMLRGGSVPAVREAAQNLIDSARSIALEWSKSKGGGPAGFSGIGGSGKALMMNIAQSRGWNFADWWELDRRETGHGADILNESSGAWGRAQFLPMNFGHYGPGSTPGASMDEQIRAMASYIASRYGNPSAALAHHNVHNWYDEGGFVEAAIGYSSLQDPPNLDSQEGRRYDDGSSGSDSERDRDRQERLRRARTRDRADRLLDNKPNPKPDYLAEREATERRKRRKKSRRRSGISRLIDRAFAFNYPADLAATTGWVDRYKWPENIEYYLELLSDMQHKHGLTEEQATRDELWQSFMAAGNKEQMLKGAWDGKTLGMLKNGTRLNRWPTEQELAEGAYEFNGEVFKEVINWTGGIDANDGKFKRGISHAVKELSDEYWTNSSLKSMYEGAANYTEMTLPQIHNQIIKPRRKTLYQVRQAWKAMKDAVERFKEQRRTEIKRGGTWQEKRRAHNKTLRSLKNWREKLRDLPQTPYVKRQLEDVDQQIRWNENRVDSLERNKPRGENPEVVKTLDQLIARDRGYMRRLMGTTGTLPALGKESGGAAGNLREQIDEAKAEIGVRKESILGWRSDAKLTRQTMDLLQGDIREWWGTTLPKQPRDAPERDTSRTDFMSEATAEQLAELQQTIRLQTAQFDVFQNFARLPFLGSFQRGTDGLIDRKGYALLHPGERVVPDPQGPFRNGINSNIAGGAIKVISEIVFVDKTKGGIMDLVDGRIAKVAPRVVSRTQGTRTRHIRQAPGR